jgi:hypothetical protein
MAAKLTSDRTAPSGRELYKYLLKLVALLFILLDHLGIESVEMPFV